jgi:FKBP-type peptidyl-prolyl cis-trans isomerase
MPSYRSRALALTPLFAALLLGPMAAAQPIEPLGSARPVPPAAPRDVAAAPPQATKTPSGLGWKLLSKGQGTAHPGPHDKVTIAFTAWTPEGDVFDSSILDGEPSTLLMDDVIKGLAEGLSLMTNGEKRRLWIPAALATSGRLKRRGASGPSVFDVELLGFLKMPDPIPVPEDVDAAPADAKHTRSGLAYRFLKRGKGKDHPTEGSTVEVHYSGWTPDGQLFDSSVRRGQPISFSLAGVINGGPRASSSWSSVTRRASGFQARWPTATTRHGPERPPARWFSTSSCSRSGEGRLAWKAAGLAVR